MIINKEVIKARTPEQNLSLMGDFIHASKSILKRVVYEMVPLTNEERATRLLKKFTRSSHETPEMFMLYRKYIVSCLNLSDFHETIGSQEYTIDNVKNDILTTVLQKPYLKIVR